MSERVVIRGNTVFFSFQFYDENDDLALVDSADLQLTYPGLDCVATETITLQSSGNYWVGEWDSTKMRPGWLHYHAHALDQGYEFAQDGRIRIRGNAAGMDHERPTGSHSRDYT